MLQDTEAWVRGTHEGLNSMRPPPASPTETYLKKWKNWDVKKKILGRNLLNDVSTFKNIDKKFILKRIYWSL